MTGESIARHDGFWVVITCDAKNACATFWFRSAAHAACKVYALLLACGGDVDDYTYYVSDRTYLLEW